MFKYINLDSNCTKSDLTKLKVSDLEFIPNNNYKISTNEYNIQTLDQKVLANSTSLTELTTGAPELLNTLNAFF